MKQSIPEYDFIIVGSGIGGLMSAVLLAMENNSVLVLEKNHQIGGSLQVFSRDKVIFDTGVHYIGSLDHGETLNKLFKYVGILDDLKMKRLDDDCFDAIRLSDGTTFKHAQGYEGFRTGLKEHFPLEEKAIDLFLSKVKSICQEFPLYNLEVERGFSYIDKPEVLSESAYKFIESLTDDKKLQAVLLGNGLLYAGEVDKTPFYVVALILNSYLKGSYRMENGGSQIAKLLTKKLHSLGGKVLKHKEVVDAVYEDEKIAAVVTCDGVLYKAKNYISNMHPLKTVEVFGEENFRPAYRNRLKKIENTVSSFMVYFSLKKDSFPYINHNIYAYTKDEVWETVDYNEAEWPEALFICTSAKVDQGEFADSLSVMAYMNYDEVKEWEHTFSTIKDPNERGESYLEFKKRKEKLVIERLEEIFPGFSSSINNVYSSTPLTYKDYIGTKDGSLYGIKKDFNQIMQSKINTRTRVPNLFLTGQNLVFHGILGASIGAMVSVFCFIDDHELINKINNVYEK